MNGFTVYTHCCRDVLRSEVQCLWLVVKGEL